MLARVAEMRANGRVRAPRGTGVLVKAPKPAQDRRFDLPSIGPQTVEGVARAGLAGIAVVAGSTIVAEPEQLVQAADRAKIFVVGVVGRNRAMSPHIFLVAGEESGDRLGAALIAAIRQRTQGQRPVFLRRRRAHGGGRRAEPVSARRSRDHRLCRNSGEPAEDLSAVFAKPRMRSSPRSPMRWSSSTVRSSLIAWRAACARGRRQFRSSIMSVRRCGRGGRAARARCARMSITCWRCCRSSRRSWPSLAVRLALMSAIR